VDRRIVGADRLQVELPMLAEAPLAWTSVSIDGLDRVQLRGLRLPIETVLEVGAHDRRRRLRPKRERPIAAVGERVHLLPHHVRALTRSPAEELRVLEHRRVQAPVSVERAQLRELPDNLLPARLLG